MMRIVFSLFVVLAVVMSVPALTLSAEARPDAEFRLFPKVTGTALDGTTVELPTHVLGEPAVLLVAYQRKTQQDVDRWLAFLDARHPEVVRFELPTITSPVWRPLAGWIDSGMRRGVPRRMWSQVVTLYADARTVRDFVGDSGRPETHVVVLDADGRVVWTADGGFSTQSAETLTGILDELLPPAGDAPPGKGDSL